MRAYICYKEIRNGVMRPYLSKVGCNGKKKELTTILPHPGPFLLTWLPEILNDTVEILEVDAKPEAIIDFYQLPDDTRKELMKDPKLVFPYITCTFGLVDVNVMKDGKKFAENEETLRFSSYLRALCLDYYSCMFELPKQMFGDDFFNDVLPGVIPDNAEEVLQWMAMIYCVIADEFPVGSGIINDKSVVGYMRKLRREQGVKALLDGEWLKHVSIIP